MSTLKEKRKFNRWHVGPDKKARLIFSGLKQEVKVLDVSAGGMKVILNKALDLGTLIEGEFRIIHSLGPFFIRGKVVRVTQKDASFETAIHFDSVRTLELTVDFFNQLTDILNH